MFASQQNITTCHNMSQTCHMRHICMPGLLQQSIPFGVAILYTLVQKNLQFVALKARKTSSLHTILI